MHNGLHLRFDRVYRIFLIFMQILAMCDSAYAVCYSTPQAAAKAALSDFLPSSIPTGSGYRVIRVQIDPVLRQRWAMIGNCSHPEWLALTLPFYGVDPTTTSKSDPASNGLVRAQPLVRAGDSVQLWKQENLLRIEVAGISEDNGDLGNTIRVRLLHGGLDHPSSPTQFAGIVRGRSNVEIQP